MKTRIYILALVSTSLFASCKEEKPVNIICLVDFSKTIASSTVDWYGTTIQTNVISQMGFRDRLIVLPIDFGSQTASQELYKVDFSKNNYYNEYAGTDADELEIVIHRDSVNSAIKKFAASFKNAPNSRGLFDKGTDIFGALQQAQKYIDTNANNIIIIFSDMLQYTNATSMNFEDNMNSIEEIEKHMTLADKADLNNSSILVLTGIQQNILPEKFNCVKSFWEQYFENCNGELIDYSSGAVSQLENVLKK
jgi:hypothetical protein